MIQPCHFISLLKSTWRMEWMHRLTSCTSHFTLNTLRIWMFNFLLAGLLLSKSKSIPSERFCKLSQPIPILGLQITTRLQRQLSLDYPNCFASFCCLQFLDIPFNICFPVLNMGLVKSIFFFLQTRRLLATPIEKPPRKVMLYETRRLELVCKIPPEFW